ncbi:unnamed protein product [Pylaiella littoralis]
MMETHGGASTASVAGTAGDDISTAIAIIHPRMRGTAVERGLRAVTRGIRVAEKLKADIVISAAGGTCAFQVHTNFSHGHVVEAAGRAEGLAGTFERCYVLLVRPNTDALRNFQLQLSPACDARPLLVPSEEETLSEVRRVSQGVLRATSKSQRREYYKQLHQQLRLDQPHRNILAELLRGLGVPEWRHEADLLLDAFGSIRGVCLQPLSALLADCPVAGETARTLHDFINEKPSRPLPCAMCPGVMGGCSLLPPPPPPSPPSPPSPPLPP